MITIGVVVLTGLFPSCSIFKKVHRSETRTEVNSQAQTEEKTVTTETSTVVVDTTVTLQGSSIASQKSATGILEGDSLVSENNQVKGTVTYDKATGKLKLTTTQKPQAITIKKTETRTRTDEVNHHTVTTTQVKASDKINEKTALHLPWYLWLIPVVVVLVYFRKKISSWW